jgi:hypothetical protein
MIDPNNDIVPTLRMFDGLMMNIAADEIEMLRARVKDLEARAAAHAQPIGEDAANGAIGKAHAIDCRYTTDDNPWAPCTCGVGGPNDVPAANVAIGEREAFEEAFRRNFEFPEHADQFTFRKGWEAGIMQARAALTAEKVAAEPVAIVRDNPDDIGTIIEATRPLEVGTQLYLAAPQQPAQSAKQDERAAFLSGRDVEELFLRWSEWTTELGEAISRKNIDGFVSDLRALLGEK